MGRRRLAHVHRNDGGKSPRSDASDDASTKDEGRVLGCSLEGAADEGEDGADECTVNTADSVGNPAAVISQQRVSNWAYARTNPAKQPKMAPR